MARRERAASSRSAAGILVAYTLLLLYTMFLGLDRPLRRMYLPDLQYNLVPLRTVGDFLFHIGEHEPLSMIINIFGNIIVFIPFGLLLPAIFRSCRRKPAVFAVSFLAPLLVIELMQMLLRVGTFDVDDLLLNSIGAGIGYKLYKTARREGWV
ncbi:VanZ family protein [Paenibacillus mucilaginosus]|uniref:VanZ family protein n=3 Tax=Paenibacillus mucilaginosus TaxID=61624 RepID=H6NN94_9BACL|nr:VanZ family protein [Paenibacillus mucilaginosus]AEI44224.1 VanZ family protein [Paenibacillus mucilaginosus KNP414]AFC31770.1 VanZ family protein [Paenibacillus mucilaginosus 3016]AFH64125.1 teicoplanin resistance protein VanZ [Paenibacillus mucilaginosus K02]MCG7216635.1 VanZ family protein [Paenibacillus mucilaginosus]WDM25631.1 VanZ family protein [Paenibacillus mucilaginosus]